MLRVQMLRAKRASTSALPPASISFKLIFVNPLIHRLRGSGGLADRQPFSAGSIVPTRERRMRQLAVRRPQSGGDTSPERSWTSDRSRPRFLSCGDHAHRSRPLRSVAPGLAAARRGALARRRRDRSRPRRRHGCRPRRRARVRLAARHPPRGTKRATRSTAHVPQYSPESSTQTACSISTPASSCCCAWRSSCTRTARSVTIRPSAPAGMPIGYTSRGSGRDSGSTLRCSRQPRHERPRRSKRPPGAARNR